jgi:hypothetical protein
MKFKKQDYKTLKEIISASLGEDAHARQHYINQDITRTRLYWDTFHNAMQDMMVNQLSSYTWMRGLYNDYNDSHIETALKRIFKEYYQD